jgi:hypothetical protein
MNMSKQGSDPVRYACPRAGSLASEERPLLDPKDADKNDLEHIPGSRQLSTDS